MRRDLAVFVVLLVALCTLAAAWPWPQPAEAHNAVSFRSAHQWLRDIVLGTTEAPPVHPVADCTTDNEGEYVLIYDPILKVWVHWACRCPGDGHGCRWFRVAWYPEKPYVPGSVVTRQLGVDKHRTCRSIVCLRHRHKHWWFAMHRAESQTFMGPIVELTG